MINIAAPNSGNGDTPIQNSSNPLRIGVSLEETLGDDTIVKVLEVDDADDNDDNDEEEDDDDDNDDVDDQISKLATEAPLPKRNRNKE